MDFAKVLNKTSETYDFQRREKLRIENFLKRVKAHYQPLELFEGNKKYIQKLDDLASTPKHRWNYIQAFEKGDKDYSTHRQMVSRPFRNRFRTRKYDADVRQDRKDVRRSDNVTPDHTCLALKGENRYFDASVIALDDKSYISCHEPHNEIMTERYYETVLNQDVKVIVSLTEMVEKSNSYNFYVDKKCPSKTFVDGERILEVNLLSEQETEDLGEIEQVKVIKIEITESVNGEVKRRKIIHQICFKAWEDHGLVPPKIMHQLTQLVNHYNIDKKSGKQKGPLMGHCHGGVGRWGTALLHIHYFNKFEKYKNLYHAFSTKLEKASSLEEREKINIDMAIELRNMSLKEASMAFDENERRKQAEIQYLENLGINWKQTLAFKDKIQQAETSQDLQSIIIEMAASIHKKFLSPITKGHGAEYIEKLKTKAENEFNQFLSGYAPDSSLEKMKTITKTKLMEYQHKAEDLLSFKLLEKLNPLNLSYNIQRDLFRLRLHRDNIQGPEQMATVYNFVTHLDDTFNLQRDKEYKPLANHVMPKGKAFTKYENARRLAVVWHNYRVKICPKDKTLNASQQRAAFSSYTASLANKIFVFLLADNRRVQNNLLAKFDDKIREELEKDSFDEQTLNQELNAIIDHYRACKKYEIAQVLCEAKKEMLLARQWKMANNRKKSGEYLVKYNDVMASILPHDSFYDKLANRLCKLDKVVHRFLDAMIESKVSYLELDSLVAKYLGKPNLKPGVALGRYLFQSNLHDLFIIVNKIKPEIFNNLGALFASDRDKASHKLSLPPELLVKSYQLGLKHDPKDIDVFYSNFVRFFEMAISTYEDSSSFFSYLKENKIKIPLTKLNEHYHKAIENGIKDEDGFRKHDEVDFINNLAKFIEMAISTFEDSSSFFSYLKENKIIIPEQIIKTWKDHTLERIKLRNDSFFKQKSSAIEIFCKELISKKPVDFDINKIQEYNFDSLPIFSPHLSKDTRQFNECNNTKNTSSSKSSSSSSSCDNQSKASAKSQTFKLNHHSILLFNSESSKTARQSTECENAKTDPSSKSYSSSSSYGK